MEKLNEQKTDNLGIGLRQMTEVDKKMLEMTKVAGSQQYTQNKNYKCQECHPNK